MSDYPFLPDKGSDPVPVSMRKVDRAADGTGYVRNFGTDKKRFAVTHANMSSADWATLEAHYSANSLAAFNFSDGVSTLSCFYGAMPPRYSTKGLLPGRRTYTVELEMA